ncbi:cytoplasmic polyadenylation element-binding protein 1-like isoform X2 [Chironomus tepperi]|uniref:cytoplasmic polyadenylation element-binding protein 1-like isoform X2 n=1 Tax=Chironomus tepperi TaxID=113505 RepID=UPI00391F7E80
MDQQSETENSLYSEIVKNLSSLMSDVKLDNEGSNRKCEETKIDQKQQIKHERNQLNYQQQYNGQLNQLQLLSLRNSQLQCLNQNQQHLNNSCYVWSGQIPTKTPANAVYSKKVFLGGLPWGFDDADIKNMFPNFEQIKVEWPLDENNHKVKGFTYVIFNSAEDVKMLLEACRKKENHFYKTKSYFHEIMVSGKLKMIEIIPWTTSDSCYINCPVQKLDASKTAFIGGIHGKLSADALAIIMNDLFGGVAFIGIDVDEHNYPKGAGRVIFNNQNSYMHAVAAKFFQVKSGKIQKKLQIDPFVQDSLCSSCGFQRGKYFCRDVNCFCYFCSQCWDIRHSININFQGHSPLTRSSNSQQQNSCNDMKFVGIKKNPIKPFVMANEGVNKTFGKKKSGWNLKNKK